jgi:hypothetical protein
MRGINPRFRSFLVVSGREVDDDPVHELKNVVRESRCGVKVHSFEVQVPMIFVFLAPSGGH